VGVRPACAGTFAALLLSLIFGSSTADAEERVLRFDIPALAPWAESGPDGGEPTGIAVNVVHMLLDRCHLTGRVRALPMTRLLAPVSAAERDFIMFGTLHDPSPPGVIYLTQIGELRGVVVARRGMQLRDMGDLSRVGPIATLRTALWPFYTIDDPAMILEQVPSIESAIRMLAAGHVNAVSGTDVAIEAIARQLGDSDLLGDELEVARVRLILAASDAESNTPEAAALRDAADAMAREGVVADFINNALRNPPAERAADPTPSMIR
jgi:hypothetical protein